MPPVLMPVPVPSRVKAPGPLDVVSPGGFGLPMSVQVQLPGQGSAGGCGVMVVVMGLPTAMLLNEAVPVLVDEPESTAIPCSVVAGMSRSAVVPGISW